MRPGASAIRGRFSLRESESKARRNYSHRMLWWWDAARWAPIPLRLIVGYGFMAHGYAKLMKDPDVFVGILHAIGVPAPHVMAWLTILVELLGGLAILLGAFVPLVSLPMAAVLLMAIFTVHLPYGFTSIKLMAVTAAGPPFGPPRYETDLLYLACLAALVAGGSGPFSVDRFIANRLSRNGNVAMLPAGDCFNSGLISQYTPPCMSDYRGAGSEEKRKSAILPTRCDRASCLRYDLGKTGGMMPKRVNSMQGLRVGHMTTARRKAGPMSAIICRPARAQDIGPASELVIASIDDLAEHHGFGRNASLRPPERPPDYLHLQ